MNNTMMKRMALAILLIVTVWLTINVPQPAVSATVKPVKAKLRHDVYQTSQSSLFVESLPERSADTDTTYDLFNYDQAELKGSTIERAQQGVSDSKLRKKNAPRLPFKYVGRLQEGNSTKIFLLEGQALHIVTKGQKITDNYQLKSISKSELHIVYLPLNIIQALSTEK